jgi:hypothetical protein
MNDFSVFDKVDREQQDMISQQEELAIREGVDSLLREDSGSSPALKNRISEPHQPMGQGLFNATHGSPDHATPGFAAEDADFDPFSVF